MAVTEEDLDQVVELDSGNLTVGELRARVSEPSPHVIVLSEIDKQTVEGAKVTLGRVAELAGDSPFAVVVDLREVPSRPSSEYREYMERWAREMPAFHAAYVLPPVGAITRMALRWVALRVLKVHSESTSSNHDSVDEAVAKCREVLGAQAQQA